MSEVRLDIGLESGCGVEWSGVELRGAVTK